MSLISLSLGYFCCLQTLFVFSLVFPPPRLRSGCGSKLSCVDGFVQACACASATHGGKNPRGVPCAGGCPSPGICRGDTQDTQGLDVSLIPQVEDQGLHIPSLTGYMWRPALELGNCKKKPLTRGICSRKEVKTELVVQGHPADWCWRSEGQWSRLEVTNQAPQFHSSPLDSL